MKKLLIGFLTLTLLCGMGAIGAVALSAEVEEPLAFSKSRYAMDYKSELQLEIIGGVAPYRFECAANNIGFSIDSDTGLANSASSLKRNGLVAVTVYDANGESATCNVWVNTPAGRMIALFIVSFEIPFYDRPSSGPILTFILNLLRRIVY